MRRAGDFYFVDRIFLSIFPLIGLRGLDGRGNKKALPRGDVLEDNLPVVFWMDILFHVRDCYELAS